jgi:ADP-ribosylglycohydrolase
VFFVRPASRRYGEQTLVLLQSIADAGGLDCVAYAHAFGDYFGSPRFTGYRDVSTKGFLRNYGRGLVPPGTGAADAQANAIARAAPLVAGWAGSPELHAVVRRATRVTQNSDTAVVWAGAGAAVLEAVVAQGALPSEAVRTAIEQLTAPDSPIGASPGTPQHTQTRCAAAVGRIRCAWLGCSLATGVLLWVLCMPSLCVHQASWASMHCE